MCTVSILRRENQIIITMNRDEALSRGPEAAPELVTTGDTWRIAPTDSDRGGTWMGANSHGVVACLLNAYLPDEDLLPDPSANRPTRGGIIPMALDHGAHSAIEAWVHDEFSPAEYPSFMLFVVGPDVGHRHTWFRNEGFMHEPLQIPAHMETSSGWDSDDVRTWRAQRFAQWIDAGEEFVHGAPSFNFLSEEADPERSPLMVRSWSSTRSVTQATVDFAKGTMDFRYWGNPIPGASPPDTEHNLDLTL